MSRKMDARRRRVAAQAARLLHLRADAARARAAALEKVDRAEDADLRRLYARLEAAASRERALRKGSTACEPMEGKRILSACAQPPGFLESSPQGTSNRPPIRPAAGVRQLAAAVRQQRIFQNLRVLSDKCEKVFELVELELFKMKDFPQNDILISILRRF